MLGHRPINALPALDHVAAFLEQLADGLVNVEIFGNDGNAAAGILEFVDLHASFAAQLAFFGACKTSPAPIQPIGLVRLVAFRDLIFAVQIGADAGAHFISFAGLQHAFIKQVLGINFGD